jgi:hypothetical protein
MCLKGTAQYSALQIHADTTIAAGRQYEKPGWHQFFWGSNYRKVWTTPVAVPVFMLDTAKGGLTISKEGGGHQTKTLRVKDKNGREYALRSISKTLGAVLPENFKGTFIEKQVNDEVTMSNPYGAAIVPVLAEAAKIYHTNPVYVYLPKQPRLDTFNAKYGDGLYLFEQKPNDDWSIANNLGNFPDFFDTEDVIEKLLEDNHFSADQKTFIRERIFDWFINDWDRHEDQWAWGERKTGDKILFVPVPQDRDQAFFKHNGVLLNAGLGAAGLNYMQSFDDNVKNIKTFTYEERNLDRFFTNKMVLSDWQTTAQDLQQLLTDAVIDKAVKQLPAEIYNVCGKDISTKLKARRTHLVEWATTYYYFISEEVQIHGSNHDEVFEVNNSNDETTVKVFSKHAYQKNDSAFYTRTFKPNETKEIRLFSVDGNDVYHINGSSNNINIKIIGGKQQDSVINESNKKVVVYDDKSENNFISKNAPVKLRLSNDTLVHKFDYAWFKYDKSGIVPEVFYNREDRVYVGLGYQHIHNAWRKEPFASKQSLSFHYSLSEQAASYTYSALFKNAIGKADISVLANYDIIRWIRFWGLGNDTKFVPDDVDYFTSRSEQWIFKPGIIKHYGFNKITFSPFIQGVKVRHDTDRFVGKNFINSNNIFKWQTFAGAELNYDVEILNDSVVPTKGFMFNADILAAQNLKESNRNFVKFSANAQVYVPLGNKFSYVLRTGAATVAGKPEFYQYASIGGAPDMRGFKRERFWGKTVFWNTHDLRFISNVKSFFFNGKAGLIAFFDNGRVWMPGENSNTWHTDVGGGITVAPFNKALIDVTYGFAKDEKTINVRFNKYF